jgi:hypothetical protein
MILGTGTAWTASSPGLGSDRLQASQSDPGRHSKVSRTRWSSGRLSASLPHVASGNYPGERWLATLWRWRSRAPAINGPHQIPGIAAGS